jgi:competence protein CoiA
MAEYATNQNDTIVFASDFDSNSWENLKVTYNIGDFKMPCCGSPAIPKTSSNFKHFFAHYSDECASSEESIWHLESKEAVLLTLRSLNIKSELEVSGGKPKKKWQADVYFELGDRKIAIEIQHSYQNLRDYFKRQERYKESGVESYWLLYFPRYKTICNSIGKYRLKNEFNNKMPEKGLFPCIPELPILNLLRDGDQNTIRAPGLFSCSLQELIIGITELRLVYINGQWNLIENA